MGKLSISYKKVGDDEVVSLEHFKRFNQDILQLGTLSDDGVVSQALAAMFDLEGFTDFCNQVDPHLVVPEYLRDFFGWLFETLAAELIQKQTEKEVVLWCRLPFYAKFMGDGVLFLWNTAGASKYDLGNLVISLHEVCGSYTGKYLPVAKKKFAKPPSRLRCGVARGQIIGIGNSNDYVGACINVAARLQKLSALSFAFSRRGFDLSYFSEDWADEFVLVQAPIRGIGEKEPIYVRKQEFEALGETQRALFDV